MSKEFKSKIDVQSESFLKNRAEMLEKIKEMHDLEKRSFNASESKRKKFEDRNQLTPRERLNALIDPDSEFIELYNMAGFLVEDNNPETSIPGASVIAGIGFIKGVRCMIMVDDSGINAGAATSTTVDKCVGCLEISLEKKLPFVHLVESAGINLMNYKVEIWARAGGMFAGLAKLSAAGVPTITILHGLSTAGGAYNVGMSDYVIGVKKNGMAALAGPALLKAATNEVASNEELGGSEMHSTVSGLVEYLAEDDSDAIEIARNVVNSLDWNSGFATIKDNDFKDPKYDVDEIAGIVNLDYKKPYDAREIILRLVDDSSFLEFKPRYGITTLCFQADINGNSCGIIANNGPIDTDGATKSAQFFQLCDKSDIPIIFLNNVTGFMVGKKYEQAGMIKHGSKMIQAVTNITVPKISLYIGASFGAGNYGMCGYAYNPDFLLSWPNAVTGVMGGQQASSTMAQVMVAAAKKRGDNFDQEKIDQKQKEISEHFDNQSSAFYTSGRLLDMGIIDPRETRKILAFLLQTCKESKARKLKSNTFGIARM
jgi:geranyl-CoA carboxylase beta subunit